jgi:hypothetical protein
MKKKLLIFSTLFFGFSSVAQQQIGNSNMEDWQNVGSDTEEPSNWNSFMTAQGGLTWAAAKQCERSLIVRPGSTGNYSARVYSRSAAFGIVANGNLTLGRINMGSSTATSGSNYNLSLTAGTEFSEALTDMPDSLVFWVRYSGSSTPRVSAVLHDTYDYRDGYVVDNNSLPHKVAEISHNYSSPNGQWVRKSLPWNYTGPASVNTFVIITFTTNSTPGGGAATDEILIDDIELIYNQQVNALNDDVTTFQNTPVDIAVLGNDADPENSFNVGSINITSQPTNGTLNVNTTTGVITYTPNAGYTGNDSFTYEICDNGVIVTCDDAIVTITVNESGAGNNQIVANDDNASTTINTPVVTNVVANDVDFEGQIDLSSLVIVNQPNNGIASANTTTGNITYTPDGGFVGADSYTYSICDLGTPATCDEATVNVNVTSTIGLDESVLTSITHKFNGNILTFNNPEKLEGRVVIIDLSGKIIANGSLSDEYDMDNSKGMYLIKISTPIFDQTIKIVR